MKKQYGINRLVGIDSNVITDLIIGIAFGVGFIILMKIQFFASIGVPTLPASLLGSDVAKFFIIVIGASVFETVFFFDFVVDLFDTKLRFPAILAWILASLSFALFHIFAYGSTSGVIALSGYDIAEILKTNIGTFYSAFSLGLAWCGLRYLTNSLLPLMVSHGIINSWLTFAKSVVIG